MKKFLIAEAEKSRILGMHYKAMGKSLVTEQNDIPWNTEIMNRTGLSAIGGMEPEYMDLGQFEVTFNTQVGGSKTFAYQCITDPRKKEGEGGFKGGTLRDYYGEVIVDPKTAGLKGDWLNYIKQYCKPANTWLANYNAKNAPQAQVAAATTQPTTVTAPNPTTDKDVEASKANAAASKANAEKMKAELTTKLADPNFLNPNKYDTDKAGLDADAKAASLYTSIQGIVMGDDIMTLKRKINTLIKAKPEYKGEPFFLNINF